MTIRILIVDDSRFICNRIREILEEDKDFNVVGIAANGKEALLKTAELEPDVITMDVEMPVMDGISAVKAIMADCPTAILMFSSATHRGAKATLDALHAGAIDFLPKQLEEIDGNKEMAKQLLRRKVRMVALQANRVQQKSQKDDFKTKNISIFQTSLEEKTTKKFSLRRFDISKTELLVIVASTGGPVAIQKILRELPSSCPFAILIVQHMPQNFTKSFSERLNELCKVTVKEAEDGDDLKPGLALLCPGGMQMEVKKGPVNKVISLREKKMGEIYSPCADFTLASIAEGNSANVLAIVLTGMGADGKEGAIKLKQKEASIWAQDEASCTIYGMPKAIVDANLADKVYSLDDMVNEFKKIN